MHRSLESPTEQSCRTLHCRYTQTGQSGEDGAFDHSPPRSQPSQQLFLEVLYRLDLYLILGLARALTRGVAVEAFQGFARDQTKRCRDHQTTEKQNRNARVPDVTRVHPQKRYQTTEKQNRNAREPDVTRVHPQKRYA